MKVTIIGPDENLVGKAGDILLSARSLADNIAVFPGKRPAHFLRKYLAEKRGGALRAPVITSMDGFIDLAAEELGIKGKEASPLDLAEVLYGRLKKELCHVIARDPGELTLDSFLPWALKLTGDFEELKIELKTRKDLSGYDSLLPEDLRSVSFIRKLESFSRLYWDFYKELEKEDLLTRSMKYARVAEEIEKLDCARYENMIFAGFFALTNSEKAVLKHLSARGAHILLEPGPGLPEQFAFLGSGIPPIPDSRFPTPALHFYKASDTHGEIFKLAQVLKDPAPGDVIVLPEPRTLFPLIENVLPGAGDYNISMGYPLAATPVYALLDALGDLLDKKSEAGYFAPNYLKFVFHPYIKNFYLKGAAEPSRVIFQTVEERLSGRVNKYVTLGEIEDDAELLREAAVKLKGYGEKLEAADIKAHIAAIHRTLIAPFEDIKNIAGFAGKLLDFISRISENSTAQLHPYWAPFVEKAMGHIIELRNSRLAGESFDGPAAYFKFFMAFIRGANYPFPGTPLKGLQVLGFLETRGLKFDRVYFLDANADILPAARKEDTILSHFVREGLGLSTYKTRGRLSRYYFSALLSGAKEAHIFYKDSADKERSPFVEKLIWDLERQGKEPGEGEVHLRISFSQAEPGAIAKTAELTAALKAREFSPSALDTYLGCGLQYYYRYALRLSEKDEISDDIEQRDIGAMVHEVLENFFGSRKGSPLNITEKDYGLIIEEAGRVFDARLKGHNAGFEYLIKRQVERRLRDILDYHRDNLPGITVLDCETKLTAELQTKHGSIKLTGRADRVDQRGGVIHIVDYKTGARASVPNWAKFDLGIREDWPATLKSTQLPFYLLAYLGGNKGAEARNMDASLMLLGSENITEETLYKERYKKTPDKAAIFGAYKEAITALIEEILDKDLPFSPPPDETPCAVCSFKNLCGRQWVE
ncbi:MAG: PD-(D/E)XK nuclease family protein [Elusimicrobiota bacterium]|nr:PD-(D/E)XK nuclease family protein [Elusimicrobiota bacterium]